MSNGRIFSLANQNTQHTCNLDKLPGRFDGFHDVDDDDEIVSLYGFDGPNSYDSDYNNDLETL